MIKLQRAKLGLPPAGVTPSMNSLKSTMSAKNSSAYNISTAKQSTPAEVATASLSSEDAQIERFINRLERRDRKIRNTNQHHHHHHTDSLLLNNGPTVPTALPRRMLQR